MNSMAKNTSSQPAFRACSPLMQKWLGIVVNLCPPACKNRSRSQPFFPTVQLYVWFITVYIRHTRRRELESLASNCAPASKVYFFLTCLDVPQSVTYRYREFPVPGIFHFFGGIGTGIGKNWYRKKVSEPVSEKFGTGKKSRNRYRKNLVPEKVSELKPLFLLPKFRNL